MFDWLSNFLSHMPVVRILSPDLKITHIDVGKAAEGDAKAVLRIMAAIDQRVKRKVSEEHKRRFARTGVELQAWIERQATGSPRADDPSDAINWVEKWAVDFDDFLVERESYYRNQEIEAIQMIRASLSKDSSSDDK